MIIAKTMMISRESPFFFFYNLGWLFLKIYQA